MAWRFLATNRKSDLDKAFLRRLRFLIEFVPPGMDERLTLWQHVLPEFAPNGERIRGEIDWAISGAETRHDGRRHQKYRPERGVSGAFRRQNHRDAASAGSGAARNEQAWPGAASQRMGCMKRGGTFRNPARNNREDCRNSHLCAEHIRPKATVRGVACCAL